MHSAYHFEWYKCNVNVQKSLLLVIHRSQYYTGINAPFFETNLSTFTSVIIIVVGISFTNHDSTNPNDSILQIVRTAASYITLMTALL